MAQTDVLRGIEARSRIVIRWGLLSRALVQCPCQYCHSLDGAGDLLVPSEEASRPPGPAMTRLVTSSLLAPAGAGRVVTIQCSPFQRPTAGLVPPLWLRTEPPASAQSRPHATRLVALCRAACPARGGPAGHPGRQRHDSRKGADCGQPATTRTRGEHGYLRSRGERDRPDLSGARSRLNMAQGTL